jgi:hypothetical protein
MMASAALFFASARLPAQVQLQPNGQNSIALTIRSLRADVSITGQFASTHQTLVYKNTLNSRIEADFIYTLPPDTLVTSFAYWYGGERVPARIFEKAEAAFIYWQITTHQRDPAIIEKIGRNRFRARIFPVMPDADLKIEMTLVQTLHPSPGAMTYTLPIEATERVPLESAAIRVQVKDIATAMQVHNNFGLKESRTASMVTMHLDRENFEPERDLIIRIDRSGRTPLVSCCSGLSHGDGYFAAAVTVDHPMRHPRVSISGDTSEVVSDSPPVLTPGKSLLITGRYRHGSRLSFRLSDSSGAPDSLLTTDLSNRPADGGVARDLWADHWMAKLSQTGAARGEIVALSKRYRLPCRYTAWLAVPKSEMQSFWFDVAVARVEDAATAYVERQGGRGLDRNRQRQQEEWLTYLCLQVPIRSEQDRWVLGYAVEDVIANAAVDHAIMGDVSTSRHFQRFLYTLNRTVSPRTNWDEVTDLARRAADYTAHDLIKSLQAHNSNLSEVDALGAQTPAHIARASQGFQNFMARDPDSQSEMAEERNIAHLLQLMNTGQSLADFMAERERQWQENDPEVESVREELKAAASKRQKEPRPNWFEIAGGDLRGMRLHDLADARRQAKAEDLVEVRKAQIRAQSRVDDRLRYGYYAVRPGDPLIRISAPEDALHVAALMPDGEIKPLIWDAASRFWQARFDVPRYAPQGDYTITVIIVGHDSARRTVAVHYHVDLTPPSGVARSSAERNARAHLEITASDNTARVKAILPWNAVVELLPAGANLFRAEVLVPESFRSGSFAVTYVLTDRAHNRTVMQIDMAAK